MHEVSLVLDGVRDVMASVAESIECSQAKIGSYRKEYLGEKHGIRILPRSPSPAGGGSDSFARSVPGSPSSAGMRSIISDGSDMVVEPASVPEWSNTAQYDHTSANYTICMPSSSSSVSSAGLTNTSDDDSN
jgi:hypothetical protein